MCGQLFCTPERSVCQSHKGCRHPIQSEHFERTESLGRQYRTCCDPAAPWVRLESERFKNTVIRAGAGLFSDQPAGTLASSVFNNVPNIYTPLVFSGNVGDTSVPGSSPSTASAANSAFRSQFAGGGTLATIQNALPDGVTFTPPGFFSTPNKLYSPKYAEWSFELQQQIGSKNAITIAYTGNHGYDLFIQNQKLNSYNSKGTANFPGLPATAPDPRFRVINDLSNVAESNYNGVTFQFRRALGYGFQGQASYTWSHSLDDVSNGGLAEYFNYNDSVTRQLYPYNRSLNYSNSDYDVRHSFLADLTWDLPFKSDNHLLNGIVSGWNMGSKFYARTGTPFSVLVASGASRISSSTGGSVLAAVVDPNIRSSCTSVNSACFTADQFASRGFGNYPRNTFRGPGYFNIDYSVQKSFPVRERASFAIGASFYNILNHPNFASPGSTLNASGLGIISETVSAPTSAYGSFQGSAVSGRVIVTTAKFTF